MHLLYCYYVFLIFISFVVLHIWLKNILRMGSTTAKRAHGRENNLRTLAVYKVSRRNSGFTASSVSGRDHHVYLCIPLFVVQSLSRVQFFATPWTATCQASLSITNSWSSLKFMSINSVMPSNYLTLCRPLLLPPSVFPGMRVFSSESVLPIRWPKYWSFISASVLPMNIQTDFLRMDWLDLHAVQGTLKSLLQHHSSKAPMIRCWAFFIVQLSHPYMTTGKNVAFTRQTFVGKVMSLLFNMLNSQVGA